MSTTKPATPTWIVLLADHGAHRRGHVLPASAELIAELDQAVAAWRAATVADRRVAGIFDTDGD